MTAGARSYYAPWIGGLSSPLVGGGRRSFFGFWLGGLCAPEFVPPEQSDETTGGFDEETYKRYRKNIEALTQATSEARKYPQKAIEAARELLDIPVDLGEIEKLTQGPELEGTLRLTPQIDYAALARDIASITSYIDSIELRIRIESELDDEAAIMLLLQ